MNGLEGMGLAMMQQTKRKNNLLPQAVSRLHHTRIAILPLTLEASGVLATTAMLPASLLICPRILGSSSSQGEEAVLSLRPCVAILFLDYRL